MGEEQSHMWRDDEEMNLLDYWRAVRKHTRLIVSLCVVSVLAAMGYSLRLPKIYESTATILTTSEGSSRTTGLASALVASGVIQSGTGLSIPSFTPQRDMLVAILKSWSMAKDVVDHFHLKERYAAKFDSAAIGRLRRATAISLSRDGIISVKVDETDPQLAADIANFYAANLDRMLTRFGITEAGRQRVFIAARLAETEEALRRAEE